MAKKEKKTIICKGPKHSRNGALFLRFEREDRRKPRLDIYPGQKLEVGKEIEAGEASKLLNNPTWDFEEVKPDE
ncbi:hypothetical protein SAMN05421743_105220 [Thalassobacillus cyri]|uniref:Uncharacterized protein n=1 Tax=Thalassobacillus cyri TaxID=571932 RepID=A0A1H4C0S1_9BACI|nr:hypothetical protein [Thalassobacillus cyri]SEA53917.1 hypothetical protein SAMN05421743_105220 [Thalassobacillus cyri]